MNILIVSARVTEFYRIPSDIHISIYSPDTPIWILNLGKNHVIDPGFAERGNGDYAYRDGNHRW